jgi:hypothetical protein
MRAIASDADIELADSELTTEEIRERIALKVMQRTAAGGYGPDPLRAGPETLKADSIAPAARQSSVVDGPTGAERAFAELAAKARLQEFTFESKIPLLGRLVAGWRRAWSAVAARWLARDLIAQQTAFNQASVAFARELLRQQEADGQRLRDLEDQVRELRLAASRSSPNPSLGYASRPAEAAGREAYPSDNSEPAAGAGRRFPAGGSPEDVG